MPLGDFVALMNRASERRPMGETFPAHNGYDRNQIAEVAFQSTVAA